MASGDLAKFQNSSIIHAQNLKKIITQAKELRAFWDKLALVSSPDTAAAPLLNSDLANYATLLQTLQDFADNVAVTAGDRRAIFERIATTPISPTQFNNGL